MWCKPSSQFLGTILETNRDDLWNKVGLISESKEMLLNSTTLELITIHYLISNQIEFKVQNKLAMWKNLKLNTIYTQSTDRIFVIPATLAGAEVYCSRNMIRHFLAKVAVNN